MTKLHYFSVIALSSLLVIVLWQSPPELFLDIPESAEHQQNLFPESYLIQSKTTQYNEQGQVSHILLSDRTRFFHPPSAPHYALLDKPYMTVFNQENSSSEPWKAHSDFAKSIQDSEQLLLSDNVVLRQTPAEGTDNTTTEITTDELLIKPNEQYAETDKTVIIRDQSGTTTATGLRISLNTETIELLSNVRSTYEPR